MAGHTTRARVGLHTNSGLMQEIVKCKTSIAKKMPGAPHEILLVLDGTTGLNMLNQVRRGPIRHGANWSTGESTPLQAPARMPPSRLSHPPDGLASTLDAQKRRVIISYPHPSLSLSLSLSPSAPSPSLAHLGRAQAREFNKQLKLTGIIVTKLDGTARGGCVVSVVDEIGVPVKFVGVGEAIEDLQPFDSNSFVEALFP